MQTLRPYQRAALDGLRASIARGRRRVLLVLPTGAGKTTVAAAMIHGAVARGKRVLFLAHRKELIDQCSQRLDQFSIPHGVIMAGHRRWHPLMPVQVASVQTLVRRAMPPADLVIVDEAHHARARTYLRILDHYPCAPVIGLTATPWRTDGRGLGELFEDLVAPISIRELIEQGFLVPVTGFAYDSPDLRAVRKRGGDYDPHGLELAMGGQVIAGHIVERYLEHGRGKRAILFATSVKHSLDLVQRFRNAGVHAEHLDGTTDKLTRERILARLASGETQVVSNVGVLTEGWDCPAVEICILARPTASVALYLQMVGRVLRPAPGKTVARIHDHAGCILMHGLPHAERDYSLTADTAEAREAREDGPSPLRQCPKCYAIFEPAGPACPVCGFVRPAQQPREITTGLIEIPLEQIDALKSSIAAIQAKLASGYAREHARYEYVRLCRIAREKGWKPKAAEIRFKQKFGFWPPASWRPAA